MPKRKGDSRPTFPPDLAEELLRMAQERNRPETDLSPLLQALAKEWIADGTYKSREEELNEITSRLASMEDKLKSLSDYIAVLPPSRMPVGRPATKTSRKLDNLAWKIIDYLRANADDEGITPRISAGKIATELGQGAHKPSKKQVNGRLKKLLSLQILSVEEDSGGQGGRRYHIEG